MKMKIGELGVGSRVLNPYTGKGSWRVQERIMDKYEPQAKLHLVRLKDERGFPRLVRPDVDYVVVRYQPLDGYYSR